MVRGICGTCDEAAVPACLAGGGGCGSKVSCYDRRLPAVSPAKAPSLRATMKHPERKKGPHTLLSRARRRKDARDYRLKAYTNEVVRRMFVATADGNYILARSAYFLQAGVIHRPPSRRSFALAREISKKASLSCAGWQGESPASFCLTEPVRPEPSTQLAKTIGGLLALGRAFPCQEIQQGSHRGQKAAP